MTDPLRISGEMADRIHRVADRADLGIYELDLGTGHGSWSAAVFKILGLEPSPDGTGTMAQLQAAIHPDDRTRLLEEFAAAIKETWSKDVRIVRADDGEMRWVSLSACFTDLDSGKVATGVMVDVTPQHRLEAELRECQGRLKGLADNLPGGVVFQSVFENGVPTIIYMSDNSERVIGVPADAVIADSSRAYGLIVEEHRTAYAEAEAKAVRDRTRFDGELQIRRPDGELRWLRMIGTPQDPDQESVVYNGVIMDTTEQKLAHEAELRALRYQVNPHFLFNSLSAVSTLILDREEAKAEEMVMSLASFYRKSLQLDPLQMLPLAEEAGLQKLYLDVETVRFPDELDVQFDIDPEIEHALVPGMILQPIVENAIKYGMGAAGSQMTLSLTAVNRENRLHIIVRNDRRAANKRAGTGFGLKMTRRRLEMAFETDFSFHAGPDDDGGYSVEMSMPVRFQEVQIAPGIDV